MFDDPGGKIKNYAKILFWLEVITGFIGGIIVWVAIADFVGIFAFIGIIIGTTATAYIISLFLVSFGELVENSTFISNYLYKCQKNKIGEKSNLIVKNDMTVNTDDLIESKDIVQTDNDRTEKLYQYAVAHMKIGTRIDIISAKKDLELISGYKDADELLKQCKEKLESF